MARSPAFGAALARARARAGYKSAYAFYKTRGKGLGLSFVNYLPLERGTALPKPWRLARLLSALGLAPGTPAAAGLVRAYARAHLGSDELYACLDEAPPRRDPAPLDQVLSEEVSERSRAGRTAQLTLEQYKILASDPDAYACNAILVNTVPGMTLQELSAESGIPLKRVLSAVRSLDKGGLAERAGALVRSPYREKYLSGVPRSAAFAAIQSRFDAHRARWAERRGRGTHKAYLLVRAREKDLRRYFMHLDEAVYMSSLYGDAERSEGSAMWLVEGKVTRL